MEPNVPELVHWLVKAADEGDVWLPDIGSDEAISDAKRLKIEYSTAQHPDYPTLKQARLPKKLSLWVYEHNESFASVWKTKGKKPLLFITYKEFQTGWAWTLRSPNSPLAPKPPQPRRSGGRPGGRTNSESGWLDWWIDLDNSLLQTSALRSAISIRYDLPKTETAKEKTVTHLLAATGHGKFNVEVHTAEEYQSGDTTAKAIVYLWVSQAIEIDLEYMQDAFFPDASIADLKLRLRAPNATLFTCTIEECGDNMTFGELKAYLQEHLYPFASYLHDINNGNYFRK
jgi:hypothetical protein